MPDRPALKTLEDYIDAPIPGTSILETQLVRADTLALGIAWPTSVAPGPVLLAEVEHGIWMVRCPYCPSAQRASFTDRRFYCADPACPRPMGTAWLPVSWPDNWAAIEALLLLRPVDQFRHWRPTETLADLEAQNAEHQDELVTEVVPRTGDGAQEIVQVVPEPAGAVTEPVPTDQPSLPIPPDALAALQGSRPVED